MFPQKKLRVTKCPCLCFASVASCMVWWSRYCSAYERASEDWLGGAQCHKIRTPAHTGAWHTHACMHVHAHTHPPPGKEGASNQAATPSVPSGAEGTSPMGNSWGWAELLYLFTGHLEHLLSPNCIGEVHSTLNHHQPDSRQNLKHRPTLSSTCQAILPHFSGQVQQSKHHPHHQDSSVSGFQGYSTPAASITFSYSYQC